MMVIVVIMIVMAAPRLPSLAWPPLLSSDRRRSAAPRSSFNNRSVYRDYQG
jgi:hypothetical protein